MATTAIETEPNLSPIVRSLLGSLRGWIRVYVCLEGVAASAAWLGGAFWASLAIDWFFEPPPAVRGVVLAVVLVVWAGVLVQLVLRRAFVRLSNGNMAMLLERRFPQLDDSLLTAVVLTGRSPDPADCNRPMLARTCHQAAERIGAVTLRRVFDPVPLQRAMVASVLLGLGVVSFGCLFPGALNTWFHRNLLFDNEPWPRKVRLIVEGFPEDPVTRWRVQKVARGADLEIIAKADTRKELPRAVQVRYRVEGGRRDREPMIRFGAVDPAEERFQEYHYTFPGIMTPLRFDVVGEVRMGRDVRVKDLHIEVVESPSLEPITLRCKYPAYMGRQPRTEPATGLMQIPQGTEVTVHAKAKKDLVAVRVDCTAREQSLPPTELTPEDLAADGRSFTYTIPSLDEDTTLLFTLSDTDGITGHEPATLTLAVTPDHPPQLTARLHGIGTAITPEARLPVVGQITDDYGIESVWFEYAVDQQEPVTRLLTAPADHPASFPLKDAALEIRDLKQGTDQKLVAGQKLLVGLKAADLYDLAEAPNIGTGERWLLDLVTPDQLRAMLESRELVLRQRFEAIIEEVTETRNLLLRVDFGAPHVDETTTATPAGEPTDAAAEPGDEPEEFSPQRQLALRAWRVQRAQTNSGKNAHETRSVAEGFDDIRLQLINNRIDTEELLRRLEEGIVKPLFRIAEEMFPRLETRLERLQESLGDEELGPQRRDLASQQANAILLEMRRVLERMLELEDFNEAVDLLRAIIKLQEELEEQTKQRHKQKIRELLED